MNAGDATSISFSSESEPLGIIGLGLLGLALADRALASGLKVCGFDLDPARRALLETSGGVAAASAQEVAQGCRFLFFVLPHHGVTLEVVDRLQDSLAPGSVILDASTGDPRAAVALGDRLAKKGLIYLDSTISGSSVQARLGEAVFMVGGAPEAFDRCRHLFEALHMKAIHTGDCGSGAVMKLVTNLVLGLNRAALAEGLVFAAALNLDPTKALEVMKATAAYSRAMDTKGEKMLRGDFEPQARLSQHLKDVRLILEAASRAGRRLPLSEAHRDLLEHAESLGLGGLDNSAILRAIESPCAEEAGRRARAETL